MDNIFFNSLVIVFGISVGTGPIGSFILWKRLSYFGDSIAHSALLGVTFAMLIKIHYTVGILLVSLFPSLILLKLRNCYTEDIVLNIISNFSIAVSIIILSILPFSDVSITSMLFGDILIIDYKDIIVIYCIIVLSVIITTIRWKKWLLMSISKELAIVARLNTKLLEAEFIILLSILIAISINIVGILLITSLLIIPAATARVLINTPIQMVILSSLICFISSVFGLVMSFQLNIPTGPSIIVTSIIILILANVYSCIRERRLLKLI